MRQLTAFLIFFALLMLFTPFAIRSASAPSTPPVADAGWNMVVAEGSLAYFDGSGSYDPDGTIVAYEWDFADGSAHGSGVTVSHVYGDNGVYMPTLTVTDNDGLTGADTCIVEIFNVAPTVETGPDQTVNEGETVSLAPATFNDKGTMDMHTATINWGDGTPDEAGVVSETPYGPPGSTDGMDGTVSGSHVYTSAGTYTVTVEVTDDDFASGSDTLSVAVRYPPVAEAGWDTMVDEGSLVYFDGSGSYDPDGTIESYEWDFGDGGPKKYGVEVYHAYGDNGVYMAILVVTDNDGLTGFDTTVTEVMNVAPWPDAGSDQTVFEGGTVYFSGSFTDPGWDDTHTIEWNFGDGSYAYDTLTPTHVYTSVGTYTVTLTVTDDEMETGMDTLTVTVLTPGVPEFPIGFALEMAFIPLLLYIWWKRKHITFP